MRIVSWNVNGIHATLKDAAHRHASASAFFSGVLGADIVCIQECKIQEDRLEKWMACVDGYDSFWAFSQEKKGYSGVVTYVRQALSPLDAKADCLDGKAYYSDDLQKEGRLMLTDHGSFVLLNVYVPNAGDRHDDTSRLEFKLRYLRALRGTCDAIVSSGRHFVIVGDFNLGHEQIDVHPKWNIQEMYSEEERAWIHSLLTEYVDLFRHFHPEAKDVYSVWNQKTDARIHNEGVRIDYTVCDRGFLPQVVDASVVKMVPKKWSDHAAVTLTLREQPVLPLHPHPAISSRNMKQFQEDQRQTKLTALFSRNATPTETFISGDRSCVAAAGEGDATGWTSSSQPAVVGETPAEREPAGVENGKRLDDGRGKDGGGETIADQEQSPEDPSLPMPPVAGKKPVGSGPAVKKGKGSSKRKVNPAAEAISKQKSLRSFFKTANKMPASS